MWLKFLYYTYQTTKLKILQGGGWCVAEGRMTGGMILDREE